MPLLSLMVIVFIKEAHLKETKAALAKRDDKLKRTIKQLDQTQTRLVPSL